LRLILGWKAEIGGLVLPMQVSWLALGLSISLAVSAWHLWKQ